MNSYPQISIATKVNPWGNGGLTRPSILEQVTTCLSSLQTECVDLLYLHAPDHNTPVEETLSAIQEVYQGMSHLYLAILSIIHLAGLHNICQIHQ